MDFVAMVQVPQFNKVYIIEVKQRNTENGSPIPTPYLHPIPPPPPQLAQVTTPPSRGDFHFTIHMT
jgi:hypothetical protein